MTANSVSKSLKRKAEDTKRPAKKKRSSEPALPASDDNESSPEPSSTEEQILELEAAIFESKKNYNNIVTLLSLAQSSSEPAQVTILATVALARVFIRLLTTGNLIARATLSEKERTVVSWLKGRSAELKQHLFQLIRDGAQAEGARATGVTVAMRILKAEGHHLYENDDYVFPRTFIKGIVQAVLDSNDDGARETFVGEFINKFADIRFFVAKSIVEVLRDRQAQDASASDLFDTTLALLSAFEPPSNRTEKTKAEFLIPAPAKKAHPLHSQLQQKKQVQDAWLALMGLGMGPDQRKQILKIMVATIAPWFTKPELLADFLTDSYDAGGATSLLALSGVFFLMTECNLDYPSFYAKLYSLLDASILHSRHRSRVFRLLDVCLGSSHLPVAMVASFIKRLSRLSLCAPPSAIVFVIPWLYNLFRKHPQTTFLMHRIAPMRDPEWRAICESEGFADPFNMAESDPMETGALDSCVWELVQLQGHYHPNVATIAKIVSEQFTKASYNVEDFLDHSYASVSCLGLLCARACLSLSALYHVSSTQDLN
jgi:U3 small nucleolar RNA-associated protein 19